jgi:hypothetical protein
MQECSQFSDQAFDPDKIFNGGRNAFRDDLPEMTRHNSALG